MHSLMYYTHLIWGFAVNRNKYNIAGGRIAELFNPHTTAFCQFMAIEQMFKKKKNHIF